MGVAYSAVVLDRLNEQERERLTKTAESLGRILQPGGLRRKTLSLHLHDHAAPDFIKTRTLLCRGGVALAYVHETLSSQPMRNDACTSEDAANRNGVSSR
ncbi:hypothetical protein C8E87_0716 [Paractinoplanes brasiliensis]|uniref:Uncharacterized protein n=1 Tax=Paractinoplanes brasiliensis TaxID=52695 RepID=A0A4V3C7C3_9ACTN|nr:hypothetical protein C8E87_0716 [Actinoplanes brasiliensis]GID32186.1 hypothetical protein Abr02nite_71690 [Actinoplanes brasiliensis]